MTLTKTHPKWKLLIEGTISYKFKLISASMLVSSLTREYKSDPTPERMEKSIDEIFTFFQKYGNLFADDLRSIFQ